MDQQLLWAEPRNRQHQLTKNIKCVRVLQLTTFSFDSNNLRDCFQTKQLCFQLCSLCSLAWTSSGIVSVESDSYIFLIWTQFELGKKQLLCQSPSRFGKVVTCVRLICSGLWKRIFASWWIWIWMMTPRLVQQLLAASLVCSCNAHSEPTVMETNNPHCCSLWIFSVSLWKTVPGITRDHSKRQCWNGRMSGNCCCVLSRAIVTTNRH